MLRLADVDVTRADGTQDALLVRVHTDDGLVGVGEADSSPYVVKTAIEMPSSHMMARGIGELLMGTDPLQIDRLWEVMPEEPEQARALAARAAAEGYGAFKLGWGPLGQDVGRDTELIAAAREGLGARRRLMIDGGQIYTVKSAIRLLERTAAADLYWFEEPFAPEDLHSYRRLSAATDVAIAAGEVESGRAAFETPGRRGCIDVLQPDLARCGGFTVGRQIRDLCRHGGPSIVPHCFSSGVLVAASLQFVAALDRPILSEYSIADSPLVNEILDPPFQLDGACLPVPTGPGLGIALNEDAVKHLRVA